VVINFIPLTVIQFSFCLKAVAVMSQGTEEKRHCRRQVLSRNLPGGTKVNHEHISEDSWSADRHLILGTIGVEAGLLVARHLSVMTIMSVTMIMMIQAK
jgi:hypothetical protein